EMECDPHCCKKKVTKTTRNSVYANKHLFDSSKSSTYIKEFRITYGTGSEKGFQDKDTVRLGDVGTNPLPIPGCTFGQATHLAQFFS
ncbi:hypothetical protein PRIPAC_76719, partial [Pristionchus pacificus]